MRKIRKGNVDSYADQMWRENLRLPFYVVGTAFVAVVLLGLEHYL